MCQIKSYKRQYWQCSIKDRLVLSLPCRGSSMHAFIYMILNIFLCPSVLPSISCLSSSSSSLLFNQTMVMNELPTTLGYVFMLLLAWLLCSTSWIVPYESTAVCRQWDEALSMQKKNFGLSELSRHLIFFLRILFEWSFQGWNPFFCNLCDFTHDSVLRPTCDLWPTTDFNSIAPFYKSWDFLQARCKKSLLDVKNLTVAFRVGTGKGCRSQRVQWDGGN